MVNRGICLMFVIGAALTASAPTIAQVITTVTFGDMTLGAGESRATDAVIDCADEKGCSAFDIVIGFDPAMLRVDSAELGPYLGQQVFVIENVVDNAEGTVHLAAAVLGAMPPPTGDVLFRLTVTALTEGNTTLVFEKLDVADAVGNPLDAQGIGGVVSIHKSRADAVAESDPAMGLSLFIDNACVACHTAGDGVGPALTTMAEFAASRQEGVAAETYLAESITSASAYVVEGYPDIMPQTYGDRLTDQEVNHLIAYILSPDFSGPLKEPEPMATTEPEPTAEPEPCFVQATRPNVDVRVGPGLHRGVRASLPVGIEIPVVGRAMDDDDQLWWQIHPPGYSEAEADRYWVLAEDVKTTGDCDLVMDTASTPVVAPSGAPPVTSPDQPAPAGDTGAAGPAALSIVFLAEKYEVAPGECVRIYWDVVGASEVYYLGLPALAHHDRIVCPTTTTSYHLRAVAADGTSMSRSVTITVR